MNKGLIVDTNILISGLVTPSGDIAKLILRDLKQYKLISPQFLFDELINKHQKIIKVTGYEDSELKEMIYYFTKRIDFIKSELISNHYQTQAYNLVKDIDKKICYS